MKNRYKNLSKDELYLISRAEFEKQKLITTQFAQKLFPDKNKASRVLVFLTQKGRLIRIEKGKYILVPIKAPNQQWMPNDFVVADLWMGNTPYYIGYFTMYNYWGFTEQIPRTIFVLNTAKSCKKEINGIRYEAVKINSKKYYGIEKIKIEDQKVCVSDRERTLVDFAYNPLGSIRNFEIALQDNLSSIDLERFICYLKKFPVVSVRKRAGFLLEKLGCRDKLLDLLQKSIGEKRILVRLDPYSPSRKGKINKEWKIIVNR
jgi:predicted transcriptional regulator of viral defense system